MEERGETAGRCGELYFCRARPHGLECEQQLNLFGPCSCLETIMSPVAQQKVRRRTRNSPLVALSLRLR